LCFMKVLGFELRALYLLSRCSIASHASRPFLLWLFWRHCLTFSSGWPGPWSTYFMLSTIAGMTGACTLSQIFSVEKGVSLTFLPRLPSNCHPPHLCFLSSWAYRHEPPHLVLNFSFCWQERSQISLGGGPCCLGGVLRLGGNVHPHKETLPLKINRSGLADLAKENFLQDT
jgi:hypothetical protein